jgi:AI-2 transport protein TqsA
MDIEGSPPRQRKSIGKKILSSEDEEEKTELVVEDELGRLWLVRELRSSLNLIAIPLLILSGLAIGFVLVWAEDILVPFVISVFFTYLLRPVVDFLSRPLICTISLPARLRWRGRDPSESDVGGSGGAQTLNVDVEHANLIEKQRKTKTAPKTQLSCGRAGYVQVPRWLAILMSMLMVMALFVGLVVLVMDAMQTFEQDSLSAYEERTVELANIALRWLKRNFNVDGTYMLAQIKNEFQLVQMTKSLLLVLMNAIAYTFIVMLFVLYMLFEGAVQPPGTESIVLEESETNRAINNVRRQIDNQIQRYLVTKTLISFVVGALTFLVLGPLLHVKMAHLFGVVTFLMNFIPNVGAVVATLLPLPIVFLDPTLSALSVVLAFLLPTLIHTVVGNIIEPIFFGQQMELHPIVVLLSLSFWFSLWGVPGAILSVPITAVIRIIVSNISHPYAQFSKNLLEGKLKFANTK